MKLIEILEKCADTQQVLVIVEKDFPRPEVRGNAETLARYLCLGMLKSEVCGIGTDDGGLQKIWIRETESA